MTSLKGTVFGFTILLVLMQPLCFRGAVAFGQDSDNSPGSGYLLRLLDATRIAPAHEVRALWVVRDALTSLDSIDRLVDFAVRTRFHLLFVQVRGRGDAYYASDIAPSAPGLEFPVSEFDPLEYLLIRCRQEGIAVHAWLNVFYVWSNGEVAPPADHLVRTHPEWLLTDAGGVNMGTRNPRWWQTSGVEGYYLSPTEPAVRAHMAALVRELIRRYRLDGIHLDYIRYPGIAFGLDVAGRTRFALERGTDPSTLYPEQKELRELLSDNVHAALDSVHTAMRVAAVDSMVLAVRAASAGMPLSAAVAPDPERARVEKGQDWVKWVYEGWIDFAVPMMYAYVPNEIARRSRVLQNTIGGDRLLPGLGIYDGRDVFLAETVALLREIPCSGAAIFSYNVLAEKRFAARLIEEAFFAEPPEEP